MQTYNKLKEKLPNNADRIAYIDFKLRFTGIVKRSDIGEMFNLSDAAASKLLAEYNKLCPNNMSYNRTVRANAIEPSYIPLLEIDPEIALGMLANGFNKNKLESPVRTVIPYEKIGTVPKQFSADCVAKVTRAIAGGYAVHCRYLSQSSENHNVRTLVPLSILHDGVFWMFRAYDRSETDPTRSKFKFFHFARVVDIVEGEKDRAFKQQEHESLASDKQWNLNVPVALELHDDRSEKEKAAIRIDYGIPGDSNQLLITERAAFLWILYKKWCIDIRSKSQIELDNKDLEKTSLKRQYYKFRLTNDDMIKMLINQSIN